MALAIESAVRASALSLPKEPAGPGLAGQGPPPARPPNSHGAGGADGAGAGERGRADGGGGGGGARQVVLSLVLVRGRPFYGFQPAEQLFIKILL
jgi:hypothetical protein